MNYNNDLTEVLDEYLLPLKGIEEVLSRVGKDAKVLVETPLGFKNVGLEAVRYLSNKGYRAHLSGQNVWGACDFSVLSDYQYIIHLGHALPSNIFRIISKNLRVRRGGSGDIITIEIEGGPIVLFSAIYYKPRPELLNRVREIVDDFVKPGTDVLVTYALPYKLYAYKIAETLGLSVAPSPITGCFIPFPIRGTVLFVGSGYFYPLTFKLLKPQATVYLLDVFRGSVENVDQVYRRYLALKVKALQGFSNARLVGIVVSRKPGQYRPELVELLINRLRGLGKEFVVIDLNEVSPDYINNLPVDVVVNTACPRIGIDDLDRFAKPVINAGDALKVNTLDLSNLLVW
ncbi:diphthamide synthesis protein [Vulcanisaeta sp. JCM 16159]|uniref:diphthamide synthesis protein n=1 Tax=Vulcanisaeta sp. JCM 16159 TaxID=1295371 RepID=UPI0006D07A40|nr:diphthamide synthesis protein [Vulcanisaeta sp. JCM 16159]